MNSDLEWEDIFYKINGALSFATARAKVPGGWLVSHSLGMNFDIATGLCFLPDENHIWLKEK